MFRNNLIKSVNQFWLPERNVCGALLKVSDAEHLIFIVLFTLNRLDVIIQMNGCLLYTSDAADEVSNV